MQPSCARNAAEMAAQPHYLRLHPNLLVAQFSLMKLLPAQRLVAAAPPGAALIESSSGTMGLALATAAAPLGLPLTLVTPPLSPRLRTHLTALGRTRIIEVDGDQRARLARLKSAMQADPTLHWTEQYNNPLVPAAYHGIGEELAALEVDMLVAPVGSGGSAIGMVEGLRRTRRRARLAVVDALYSVLFGRPDGTRRTAGLGNSILPGHLDHGAVDVVHWMSDGLLAAAARTAARELGLFVGPTGAGALLAAMWHSAAEPGANHAAILPDEGHRYLDSVFAEDSGMSRAEPVLLSPTAAARFDASQAHELLWLCSGWRGGGLPLPQAS